jgi:beta-glucanase (GH16 family)
MTGTIRSFLLLILVIITLSCTDNGTWRLVWSDEFDYEGKPDPDKWMILQKPARWVNNEAQSYEDNRENVRIENGTLIIQAHHKKNGGYTSGRLDTYLSGKWTYGRIEVKAKLPRGRGTWPAIFMMASENIKSVHGWPSSGEIDIMEHVGHNPSMIHATIHCYEYNHPKGNHKSDTIHIVDPFDEYHIYAVEWYPDRLDFFVDDNKYFTFNNEMRGWKTWPFYKDFYLILCLAIGGSWGGAQGIDDSIFPVQIIIDYVRVYQTDLEKIGYDIQDYQIEE